MKILDIFKREPDVFIGGRANPYMKRWHIIPRNRFFNIYLHHFLRSDDDRALHDHPWWNVSILLKGSYLEHLPNSKRILKAPCIKARGAKSAHRIQLFPISHAWIDGRLRVDKEHPVWTLFITGPKIREWGFHCPQGWRHWLEFTANNGKESTTGRGCE